MGLFKSIESWAMGSPEEKPEKGEVEAAPEATRPNSDAVIDRRQKLAPKAEKVANPGDVKLDDSMIAAAREELWSEGNHAPTEQEIIDRARAGVFSTMPEEEVAGRVIDAMVHNEETRTGIEQKINTSLKTDFVIQLKKQEQIEEQERKIEEEARVKALRQEMSQKTARAIEEGIEQSRKIEEMARVEEQDEANKREEVERVAALKKEEKRKLSEETARVIAEAAAKKKGPVAPDEATTLEEMIKRG
jgi:hypothetical protein